MMKKNAVFELLYSKFYQLKDTLKLFLLLSPPYTKTITKNVISNAPDNFKRTLDNYAIKQILTAVC